MAITSTPKKISVAMKLNDGLDDAGNVKTVKVSLGSLSLTGYDDEKALAIIGSLEDILTKTVYSIEKTTTTNLESE